MTRFWPALERVSQHALSIAGWCYLAMTGFICFDIVARRMLGFSSGATSELSGYLLGVGMTWGLAATLLDRCHVRIDLLVQKLPLGLRVWLHAWAIAALLTVAGAAPRTTAAAPVDAVGVVGRLEAAAAGQSRGVESIEDVRPSIPQLGEAQLRLLARVGVVDPTSIAAYRASGGYRGLAEALRIARSFS